MTSYIMFKIGQKWYPLKVGGYQGKKEIQIADYEDIARKLRNAEKRNDIETIEKLTKKIMDSSIDDVKTGYMVWVPGHLADKVTENKKYILAALPDGNTMKIKIRGVKRWSRGSKVILLDGRPFSKLSKKQIKSMINFGIKSLKGHSITIQGKTYAYTLKRTERKPRSTREPSLRGMSGQIDIPSPEMRRRRPGKTKESKTRILSDGTVQVWIPPATYSVDELRRKVNPTKYEVEALEWINREGEKYKRKQQVIRRHGYIYDREAQIIHRDGHWRTIGKTE